MTTLVINRVKSISSIGFVAYLPNLKFQKQLGLLFVFLLTVTGNKNELRNLSISPSGFLCGSPLKSYLGETGVPNPVLFLASSIILYLVSMGH